MIRKSGNRFSEKDHAPPKKHDPEKWKPVFMLHSKSWSANRFHPNDCALAAKPAARYLIVIHVTDQNMGAYR